MKRINGKIVAGAPHSAIRYEKAESMCVECWLSHPQPIMTVTFLQKVRENLGTLQLCYVCECERKCYLKES